MVIMGRLVDDEGVVEPEELADRVARAMSLFVEAGVGEGDAVALLLRNGRAFVEATMAAQNLGAYAVPINWHFAAPEVGYVLQDCGASVVVGDADLLTAVRDSIAEHVRVFAVGAGADAGGFACWTAALAGAEPSGLAPRPAVSSMIYTSGTTGKPKGVRRLAMSAEQAAAVGRIRRTIYSHEPGMRALLSAPLYHSAPNFFGINTLRCGGTLILRRRFDAQETLRLIDAEAVSHMFMVPTMFVRLLALPDAVRAGFSGRSLQWVLHAGAPCPPDVKSAMIAWWGPVLAEYYGSTELGPLTFCDAAEWLAHRGTVGRPLDGVGLSVRDADGAPCADGVAGEICVERTPQADFTYHGDDAKRRAVDMGAGLATGDIGYRDADGYIFICDRRTDMIISGGVNIYPAEIEAALMGIGGIADCAVVGMPDAEYGEAVLAFVQVEPGAALSAPAIAETLRARIAGYKVPREIRFADTLPRDDSGKIFKRRLREQVAVPA